MQTNSISPSQTVKPISFLSRYTSRVTFLKEIENKQNAFASTVMAYRPSEEANQKKLIQAYIDYWEHIEVLKELIEKYRSDDSHTHPTPVLDALIRIAQENPISDETLQQFAHDQSKLVAEFQTALGMFSAAVHSFSHPN